MNNGNDARRYWVALAIEVAAIVFAAGILWARVNGLERLTACLPGHSERIRALEAKQELILEGVQEIKGILQGH